MRQLLLIIFLVITITAYGLHDPTRPFDYSGPAPGGIGKNGLTVSAIIYSKQRKIAVINGQNYVEGDKLLGTTVLKINKHSVLFENSDGEFDVPLLATPTHPNSQKIIMIKALESSK